MLAACRGDTPDMSSMELDAIKHLVRWLIISLTAGNFSCDLYRMKSVHTGGHYPGSISIVCCSIWEPSEVLIYPPGSSG
jgi:hypothetical protein